MKALITGAAGFIGRALALALTEAGWGVRVLIRPGRAAQLPSGHPWEVVECDLAHPAADSVGGGKPRRRGEVDCPEPAVFSGCDVVVHAAAIRNRWGTPSETYYAVNVDATRRLIAAAIGSTRRFVYLSSVGVFGRPGLSGIDETFPIVSASIDTRVPQWDYHTSKAEAERVVMAASGLIETVIVRPTITYGPGDVDGMVTRLIELVARRRFFRIGSGRNHIHLTYISDLTDGLQRCMTHPAAAGQAFILAGLDSIEVNALMAEISRRLRVKLPEWRLPTHAVRGLGWGLEHLYHLAAQARLVASDSAPLITRDKVDNLCVHRSFSSQKAIRMLGYDPRIDYQAGLEKTLEWLRVDNRV